MRKFLAFGLSAVVVAMSTCRTADAWVNAKFSIGLNWHIQTGNNCFLWGLFRNGQAPSDYGYFDDHHGWILGPTPGQTQQQPWHGSATPTMPNGYGNYYPPRYSASLYPYYGPGSRGDVFTWFYQP